ncbi:MAG TPA: PEGA domain-containing protein [Polyangiaceae bacterium]
MARKLRLHGAALLIMVAAFALLSMPARADPAAAEEAKRHFTNGVHLFEDRNFAGALVEFEASFQQNPTPAALQNIAVCQKGLFRYAEAIATLQRMLRDFATQLSPEDKRAAEDAIREMSALLGTVIVKVTPPDARVTINDSVLSADAMKRPVRLSAGEYRVAAEAPGYARQERVMTVVSGQKDVPLNLTLVPFSGTLVVRAHDSQAAIAIDGAQVGYDEWKGPVSAGQHEVYVYTSKLRHKSTVVAYAGQTTQVEAKLTPQDAVTDDQAKVAGGPPPYVPPSQRGVYGFVVFGPDTMASNSPNGLYQEDARNGGSFGGIDVGYRFSTGFAAEFRAETATHQVAACEKFSLICGAKRGNYRFQSTRIGPAIRLMTPGGKGRFVATIGVGAAVLTIDYDAVLSSTKDPLTGKDRQDLSSVGSYLQLVGGYELNLGHFLVDAGLGFTAESHDKDKSDGVKGAASFSLELRLGYGQW